MNRTLVFAPQNGLVFMPKAFVKTSFTFLFKNSVGPFNEFLNAFIYFEKSMFNLF
jgi:hypothetical protein